MLFLLHFFAIFVMNDGQIRGSGATKNSPTHALREHKYLSRNVSARYYVFFFSERTFGNGWLKTLDQMNKEEPDGANNNPAAQAVPKMEVPETSNSSDIKDEDGVWSADIEQVLANFRKNSSQKSSKFDQLLNYS